MKIINYLTLAILQISAHFLTTEAVSTLVNVSLMKVTQSYVASVWLDILRTLSSVMLAHASVS